MLDYSVKLEWNWLSLQKLSTGNQKFDNADDTANGDMINLSTMLRSWHKICDVVWWKSLDIKISDM